jgi:hypothetical protein
MLVMVLASPTGDGAAGATLVVVLCRLRVMLATMLPSQTSDDTIKATWLRRNVDAESC